MERCRRNAHDIAKANGVFRLLRANPQNSFTIQNIENLLGVIVLVKGRRFTRFQNDNKDLRGLRIRAVHDKVVDMRGESVTFGAGCGKHELHDAKNSKNFLYQRKRLYMLIIT